MKKIIWLIIFIILSQNIYANWLEEISKVKENSISLSQEIHELITSQVSINSEYTIDLTTIKESLENEKISYEFEWEVKWAPTQTWAIFKKSFIEKWEKELILNIYQINKPQIFDENEEIPNFIEEKKLFLSNTYKILVYDKSFFILYSNDIDENDVKNYIDFAWKDGIYIYTIWPLSKTDIEIKSLLNNIKDYKEIKSSKSDFIIIWWSRDFVFNILSNINKDISTLNHIEKYNIIWISSYNLNILWNYLRNFLANKSWIKKLVLLNENAKYIILKQNQINSLIDELSQNKYEFLDIDLSKNQVRDIFFVSKFINNLSNTWYSTSNIYIFLIIPIILTIIIIFKHFIWLSPIWIIIPLFVSLLFFKIWVFVSLFLIIFFVILNLLLSVITTRYNLLYSPKIVFLITINIISFIIILNLLQSFWIVTLNFWDILYFVIFILLSEKIINIINSKDIFEYKESFFYTIFIWLFCYLILNINTVKIILFSYPEIILLLIPINFWIWKFTWLRVTEYFRFKEIIKSIEE